jgi:hypothetical protein
MSIIDNVCIDVQRTVPLALAVKSLSCTASGLQCQWIGICTATITYFPFFPSSRKLQHHTHPRSVCFNFKLARQQHLKDVNNNNDSSDNDKRL